MAVLLLPLYGGKKLVLYVHERKRGSRAVSYKRREDRLSIWEGIWSNMTWNGKRLVRKGRREGFLWVVKSISISLRLPLLVTVSYRTCLLFALWKRRSSLAFFSKELLGNHAYEIRRLFHTFCCDGISDSDGRKNLFIFVSFDPERRKETLVRHWILGWKLLLYFLILLFIRLFFPRSDLRAGSEGEEKEDQDSRSSPSFEFGIPEIRATKSPTFSTFFSSSLFKKLKL